MTTAVPEPGTIAWLSPLRLAGPILDKELRVASRQRRTYAMRSAYLILLAAVVAGSWWQWRMTRSGSAAGSLQLMQMAEAARRTVMSLLWFQFIASQAAAVLLVSNSFCDEIRKGTLYALMSTPIRDFQIVVGKLLSRLVQLILLLSLSLAALAVLRVFGGVAWGMLWGAYVITVTAAVTTAALTLFLSLVHRDGSRVILSATVVMFVWYTLSLALGPWWPGRGMSVSGTLVMLSPFSAMMWLDAQPGAAVEGFSLGGHAAIMLGISGGLVAGSVLRLRSAGLRAPGSVEARRRQGTPRERVELLPPDATVEIAIAESPVVWRETRRRARPWKWKRRAPLVLAAGLLLGIGGALAVLLWWDRIRVFSVFSPIAWLLWLYATVKTLSLAATAIVREKEARTWETLLTTPLTRERILRDKAVGVLRRMRRLWIAVWIVGAVPYTIYFLTAAFGGAPTGDWAAFALYIPVSVVAVAANVLFIIATGLFFSVRAKSGTAAVVGSLATVLLLSYLWDFVLKRTMVIVFFSVFSASSIQYFSLLIHFGGDIVPALLLAWWLYAAARRRIQTAPVS